MKWIICNTIKVSIDWLGYTAGARYASPLQCCFVLQTTSLPMTRTRELINNLGPCLLLACWITSLQYFSYFLYIIWPKASACSCCFFVFGSGLTMSWLRLWRKLTTRGSRRTKPVRRPALWALKSTLCVATCRFGFISTFCVFVYANSCRKCSLETAWTVCGLIFHCHKL